MKTPRVLLHKLLLKWLFHRINAEFLPGWELGTAKNGPIVFFFKWSDSIRGENKDLKSTERWVPAGVWAGGVEGELEPISGAAEQVRGAQSRCSRQVGQRDLVPISVLGACWVELKAAAFWGTLWKCSSQALSSLDTPCSYLKSNCFPIPRTSLITATLFSSLCTTYTHFTKEQIRLSLTGSHATLPQPGSQIGPFLPWAPLLLEEVWWSSEVIPVFPCTLAVTPPATAWAMGKRNRHHCPVSELRCLWTNQANAFKGMSLNSLQDWIQAVGPDPAVPAMSTDLGVSGHLPRTSVLVVVVGGTGLHSPSCMAVLKRVGLSVHTVSGVI